MRGDHKVPSWLEEETGKGGVLIDTSPSTSSLFLSSLKHRASTWLPGFETDLTHGGRGHVRLCSPSPAKCSRKTEAECKPVCVCREVRKGEGIQTHTHTFAADVTKKKVESAKSEGFWKERSQGRVVSCSLF